MKSNTLAIAIAVATLSCLSTYVVMQDKLTSNHPLSLDEQLAADELTITNEMLLKDVIRPAFDGVALVGVSTSNSCSAFEKGCFGNREMTENEFATYTGRGPQLSLLIYQTNQPITAENMQQLKTQLNTGPYSLKESVGVDAARSQEGVSSLYDLSVLADIGDTLIRVVIRPLS